MKHWLYPANPKYYRVFEAFDSPRTYWPISTKVEIGDIIYIYLSAPHKQIGYMCDVEEIGIDLPEIEGDIMPYFITVPSSKKPMKQFMKLKVRGRFELHQETKLSLDNLRINGLNGMLMGARNLDNNQNLLKYITEVTK